LVSAGIALGCPVRSSASTPREDRVSYRRIVVCDAIVVVILCYRTSDWGGTSRFSENVRLSYLDITHRLISGRPFLMGPMYEHLRDTSASPMSIPGSRPSSRRSRSGSGRSSPPRALPPTLRVREAFRAGFGPGDQRQRRQESGHSPTKRRICGCRGSLAVNQNCRFCDLPIAWLPRS
jgi:hypothetical protein